MIFPNFLKFIDNINNIIYIINIISNKVMKSKKLQFQQLKNHHFLQDNYLLQYYHKPYYQVIDKYLLNKQQIHIQNKINL